jgi:gas vesicle protein
MFFHSKSKFNFIKGVVAMSKEQQTENCTSFAKGLFIGSLVGAVAALLWAPKSGREMREDLSDKMKVAGDKSKEVAYTVGSKVSDIAKTVSNKTCDVAQVVGSGAGHIISGVKQVSADVAENVKDTAANIAGEVAEASSEIAEDVAETAEQAAKKIKS